MWYLPDPDIKSQLLLQWRRNVWPKLRYHAKYIFSSPSFHVHLSDGLRELKSRMSVHIFFSGLFPSPDSSHVSLHHQLPVSGLPWNQTHHSVESLFPEASASGGEAQNCRSQNLCPSSGFSCGACWMGLLPLVSIVFRSTRQVQSGRQTHDHSLTTVKNYSKTVALCKWYVPRQFLTFTPTKYRAVMTVIAICWHLWREPRWDSCLSTAVFPRLKHAAVYTTS